MTKQSKDILKSISKTLFDIAESCANISDQAYEAQDEVWRILDEDDEGQDVD